MEINDKKLKRTSKIINFLISTVLAVFLILLANVVMRDLNSTVRYPDRYSFVDQEEERRIELAQANLRQQTQDLREQQQNFQKMLQVAEQAKENEQESFDNWIKTRNSLQDPNQDTEVLKRVKMLDEHQKVVQTWRMRSDSVENVIAAIDKEWYTLENENNTYRESYDKLYEKALNSYNLKVFLIRLLFASPILILGIFFFIRFRRHRFSPLFMGFSLFSVYVFFVGLVPYLPSYGGYIRYSVGILLTFGLGWYAIKRIRIYTETRKAELKESTSERANKLQTEIVERAFNNHVCPSCGKDFLLKSWEQVVNIDTNSLRPASSYCRYCGLQLFKKCSNCQQENYANLPYCVSCGTKIKD